MGRTAFYWDERCFWHAGGNYALTMPVGGLIQPQAAGGLAESPETKRRLKNLMEVTGLIGDLDVRSAPPAGWHDLIRVHPEAFLHRFKELSDGNGGEIGEQTPFGPGGFDIACVSAGLAGAAVAEVLRGTHPNAYALSRPPGHHCLPDWPNGFCLLANIAIAIEAARADGLGRRFAVVDWDVHHGNGTEAIFYDRDDVLTISIHQDRNYPEDTGFVAHRGRGAGEGFNMNVPLPPGAGHATWLEAVERLVVPALAAYRPDIVIVACGYDAALVDPLSRMMCTAETYRLMTRRMMEVAAEVCAGKLAIVHEGGYSELYVPFCGHAVIEELSGSAKSAPDPLAEVYMRRQPPARMQALFSEMIGEMAAAFF
ncbi:class II histone deacetylase [Maritimibacter sp. 55A14]|uniref:class II histone deacetylase n=1 Tax=Maritimibacter sp. 55A14 TaxID=2174844 RepID=UPI000D608A13|nr:class II histone deacetylase [Maritimibacter sp. 55A14]PWE33695.1 class II histone deacetylase [Maritimibacter sp. 55A14]